MTNILLTITGPSLSGKTTMENMLVDTWKMEKLVSFTTRPIREGEVNGKHYHFLNKEEAQSKIENGEMAEHIEFNGYFYGLLGSELQEKLKRSSCIAVVEPRGVKQLSQYCKEAGLRHRSIFITNSPEALAARFLHRFKNDKDASAINYATRFVSLIRDEQAWIHEFDYNLIFNRFDPYNQIDVINDVHHFLKASQ